MTHAPRACAALLLSPLLACAQTPMSYFRTFGPAGDPATTLGWLVGWVSVAVMLVIGVLLLVGVFRRRGPAADPRALTVARDAGGMAWIYVGSAITAVVLLVCTVWTMFAIAAGAMPAHTAFTVEVTGSQWWWGVRYDSDDPAQVIDTANEIHIPVGQPVRFNLVSHDVIHSFWIPKLGGKMDVIPGKTNSMWLQADRPGTYRGQCAEYCGAQHAHMAMLVVADPPEVYRAWRARELQAASRPTSAQALAGEHAFMARCAACHAVRGTGAGGILGPDLTHLMARHTLAAGLLPNTRGNLGAWISDPQKIKPGSLMPNLQLSAAELSAVLAYLETLD